MFFLPP
jgi:hypothetical protein